MIADRNLTVHTYDQGLAKQMGGRIRKNYHPAFNSLFTLLKKS